MAIALAQEAVNHPDYDKLSTLEKRYILLPFMHSESLELHNWAYKYFEELGDDEFMHYEMLHREVLEKFGRYPYQNDDLGRESTPEELEYIRKKGGRFYS